MLFPEDGVPAYFPGGLHPRPDDAKSHIEGVITLLEEEDPAYDPRTQINIEASKLYWGTKKRSGSIVNNSGGKLSFNHYSPFVTLIVKRKRSVQRSIEYA